MILLDANILVIDAMYPRDANFATNASFLSIVATERIERGITLHGLLEVVGKRSHNVSSANITKLPSVLAAFYGLWILPDPATDPDYAGGRYSEVVSQIEKKMSLGDAVMALQIERYASHATALITWNAKHFVGKLAIPAMTPAEWLAQRP